MLDKTNEDDSIVMPDLTGIPYYNAISYLDQKGITIDKVFFDENNKMINNCIINQSIKPGTKIIKDSKINITLSSVNPIKYLPSIYQSMDQKNNNFLKNYLWIFTHIFNELSLKLDNINSYFTPLSSPSDFLNWLASWFSLDINYSISEERMRLLVREIVNIYQWRGTALGIAKFLEIITGYKPSIYENFRPITEYVIKDDRLVERFIVDEKYSKNFFTVHFHIPVKNFDIDLVRKINDIVKSEKPANSEYYLSFEKEKENDNDLGFYIGVDEINNNTL